MKQRRKKKKNRNEDNFGDLWNNVKCPNIRIIGVPEEDKKKDHEKILEEIIVDNFPKMRKKKPPKSEKPRESQTGQTQSQTPQDSY